MHFLSPLIPARSYEIQDLLTNNKNSTIKYK